MEDSKLDTTVQELCENLINQYYNFFDIKKEFDVDLIITDDIKASYCEIRPDKSADAEKSAEELRAYNGFTVLPKTEGERISILLNAGKIREYTEDRSFTWVGSLAHELTHANDYYKMFRTLELEEMKDLEAFDFWPLQMWTEYHARKMGHVFLRRFFGQLGQIGSEEDAVAHILNNEWPMHIRRHFDDYHNTADGYKQLYITMQLLGRYSVWNDLYPDRFNVDALQKDYFNNQWMVDLYAFLYTHEDLGEFNKDIGHFKDIVAAHWKMS